MARKLPAAFLKNIKKKKGKGAKKTLPPWLKKKKK